MPNATLLDVVASRFGVAVDPDSDGGLILNSLTPRPEFADDAWTGQADVAPLTFTPTSEGISIRAAQGADALVFSLPAGPLDFTLVPPNGAQAAKVELQLLAFDLPLAFLHSAEKADDGTLRAGGPPVELHFPDLLLVVTASTSPPASARLAPSTGPGGELEVTMTPPFALLDSAGVVGFGFERALLELEGPGAARLRAPNVEVYLSPPGIPALALSGGAHDLRLDLGTGGLSGEFRLSVADGAHASARPRFLHDMAARLRLERSAVVLLELTGQLDLSEEISARLGGPLEDPSGPLDYTLALALDDGWRGELALRAGSGSEVLWRTGRTGSDPGAPDLIRDTLGAYAVLAPLLAGSLPDAGGSGYVDLALGAGAASTVAASQSIRTRSVTLHGANLSARQSPGEEPEAHLIFDLEAEIDITLHGGPIDLRTSRSISVRHQAIGLKLDFGESHLLRPVFDPAQGFGLDISDPGMWAVPAPLGDLLQPIAARIARENSLHLEVDLELTANLGVVTVDRTSVRVPLDSPRPPTLTALGAHIDVPGAVSGDGYLKLLPGGGFSGSLDAAIASPLGIRVEGGLEVRDVPDRELTAVLATLGVELPVPLPLANSGLGLFGFLGLFGMHYERDQPASMTALQWFVERAQGSANRLEAWKPQANRWSLGLGAVLGTMEGGFLFHAKGMVVLELPGPRVLLVMRADILKPRPATGGTETGNFLAVIEIRPESITIGVVVDYSLKPLLEIRVPVEAYFDLRQAEKWHLDVGGIPPGGTPVSIKFLSEFRAEGYLLIHGDGIPDFPPRPLPGFAVAAGIRAAFTWGPEAIGLYLRVAAQADLGISFKPFLLIGRMALSGELHLFVVSIEASASAEVVVTEGASGPQVFISARVCGSVDFFFFDVGGCVTLELGDRPTDLLPAPGPLVRAMSLHSRSPALLPGSGTDRPVDGSLGDAATFDVASGQWLGEAPVVPIDAIPVLQMDMRPYVDPACRFLEEPIEPVLPQDGWLRRGERYVRYSLRSVELIATDSSGVAHANPVTHGTDGKGVKTPTVWWDRYGRPTGGDDNDVQLALLSWTPDPTPTAAERTVALDERVRRRWGGVCAEVAPPARVLWTFRQAVVGPAITGWTLPGTAWPDDPSTRRSVPPPSTLRVTEPWRTGDPLADAIARVTPAVVIGDLTSPEHLLVGPRTGDELLPLIGDDKDFDQLFGQLHPDGLRSLPDALRLDADGLRSLRLLLAVQREPWESDLLVLRGLDANGEQTGFEQALSRRSSTMIDHLHDLPGEWLDRDRPWAGPVEDAVTAWFRHFSPHLENVQLVLFEFDGLPDDTVQVEIGLLQRFDLQYDNRWFTNWALLVVEGVSAAELRRFEFDRTNRHNEITTVNGALGADQASRALLHPDSTYTLDMTYDATVTDVDDQGNPVEAHARTFPGQRQQFRFRTDQAPPARLDPWLLATDPGDSESFFFYDDLLHVVFATNATRALLKAYGRDLFAVVKAASGKHPPQEAGFDPERVQIGDSAISPTALTALVVSPFAAALGQVASDLDCVDATGRSDQHERVTLRMRLQPRTDYILDLETQPPTDTGQYPLFRRHFSTSSYATMGSLAAHVLQTPVRHMRVGADGAGPLLALAAREPDARVLSVPDLEFELLLRAMRWGELRRPTAPRVTVIRVDGSASGSPSGPVAVMIETTEPLWRDRGVPQELPDAHGTCRYQLQSQPWLEVTENESAAGRLVSRFVRATSGDRTLAILEPWVPNTGGALSLELCRHHHRLFEGDTDDEDALLVALHLDPRAPWEQP